MTVMHREDTGSEPSSSFGIMNPVLRYSRRRLTEAMIMRQNAARVHDVFSFRLKFCLR